MFQGERIAILEEQREMLQSEIEEKSKEIGAMKKEREDNRFTIRELSDKKDILGADKEKSMKAEMEVLKKVSK